MPAFTRKIIIDLHETQISNEALNIRHSFMQTVEKKSQKLKKIPTSKAAVKRKDTHLVKIMHAIYIYHLS